MKKQAIMPIVVLTVICIAIAALLGGVHELTKDRIESNALKKEQKSLFEVMPGAELFEEITEKPEGTPSTIKTIYREKNGLGYVFIVIAEKTAYSSGDMTISVGISNGEIVGVAITSYNESRDVGKETYPKKFIGKTEADFDDVEITADVTFSSNAFKSAIGDALDCEKIISSNETASLSVTLLSHVSDVVTDFPRTDIELTSLMTELVPGATFEEKALPYGADSNFKRMFAASTGGYVAYLVVPGDYVPVATEALVYVNDDCKIESINLLQWVVGHGVEPGDFAGGFVGSDTENIGDVEIVAGATGTSDDFKKATANALKAITDLTNSGFDAIDLDLGLLLNGLVPGASFKEVAPPSGANSTLTEMFATSKGGYVAHIIVPGDYVPVATEALVYVNDDCKIESINLLQWVVGHGVEPGDFAGGFVGSDTENIGDVEIVAGATGTSNDFKNAAMSALAVITEFINDPENTPTIKDNLPKTDEELAALLLELVPGATFEEKKVPDAAGANFKKMYAVSNGGYVAYIVVPGEYVPVATEALIYVDKDGVVKNVNLLQWVVGHGVGPDDFAKGFIGTDIYHIGNVDIVAGATGTSNDFINAATNALEVLTGVMDAYDEALMRLVDEIMTNSGEIIKLDIPEGAPKTLVGLYTDSKNRGTVAHVIVPGEYVPVATEALVFFDQYGKISKVNIIKWIVGHGVGYGEFEENFVGASTKEEIGEVELVAQATGTSSDFRNALVDIYPYIPIQPPTIKIVAAAILVLSVSGFVTALLIKRKRWACK